MKLSQTEKPNRGIRPTLLTSLVCSTSALTFETPRNSSHKRVTKHITEGAEKDERKKKEVAADPRMWFRCSHEHTKNMSIYNSTAHENL